MIRSFLAAVSASLLCLGAAQAAPAYPDKPITLLIPYPPGGSADMLARPLGAELQKKWGQPVVLEYKPGAGGAIASAQLARAKPDGYTVLMVLAAHAINPSLYPSLPYDTRKDFAPVGYQRYNKRTGKTVDWNRIVKGYEYKKGQYVALNDEDFRRANVKASQTIDIVRFVERSAIAGPR